MTQTATAHAIEPRRVRFDFSEVPRYWLQGRPFETHLYNALNAMFPPGEHLFVRVCRKMVAEVSDPQLRRDVQGFIGQESNHAVSHIHLIPFLEDQGFPMRRLMAGVERRAERGERFLGPRRHLALIAGIEHFTATLGAWAFESGVFAAAHPVVRDLLLWHAAEEIEHKAVVFDLLRAVRPGYAYRIVGLLGSMCGLFTLWTWITLNLIWHDRETAKTAILADALRAARQRRLPFAAIARGVWRYLKPAFHPNQEDNLHFARSYFAAAELRQV